jgi:hypothetical protein
MTMSLKLCVHEFKEKHYSFSDSTYVWIFEELFESMITVHINLGVSMKLFV